MNNPLLWLGISFLLVAVSLTAVFVVLIPVVQELARAARSVERLCDTLTRELPPTLDSIRMTSLELTELTDDVTQGVHQAGRVVQQVDEGITGVRHQAHQVQVTTRSVLAGMGAAWKTLTRSRPSTALGTGHRRRSQRPKALPHKPKGKAKKSRRSPRPQLPPASGVEHDGDSYHPQRRERDSNPR